ncbi:hypothetical protein A2331_05085 [Candidatus Falkowbacteria bacterium RIFOXYB2_FULL_34_18]|uniref:GyrI-like small molecule binding domain-containing protein n=1 Tax=Candidatus Falkowbacteria bacterium RIFOXYD2_FULL_34_120 TaxID=1798007 RepID=A0A1F5TN64_9BACT|nr:MAG: hypothetical protein A2500_07160 [Candidatus Falkowbacteria bacterium RIFOXYC12_FULL_34_55]OGF28720.1 MAG: hypothetical protein A2331_05085 [Candidatus Falkowbacteria bacterium RIFOXYB2_FULL_34_18]OGF38085.1 MAG: hypothetical protein A2466_04265 [Candidatus Falkowbacteria bacterium RIFOXYC2_FULL_34_220]OGF38339.1 MAG: hypothetical protein A2515_06295 [Candidatus Falkowbacteria bacterium RIFOXYD12_FULL_34_57]OGF40326.1 MAG: hypothetical protein A2531_00555 [Candidatus Falkowbacteria bact
MSNSKKFIIWFIIFGLLVLLFAWYVGFFYKIEITEREMGPYYVVYEGYEGPYQDTGKIQEKIYQKLLLEEEIRTYKGFGIYYDDPQKVVKDKLRSDTGCILEDGSVERIHELQNKQYQLKKIDKKNSLVVEFPFKNRVSIMAGVFRVYPRINEYMSEKGYGEVPMMEIYDVLNKKIIYIAEIKTGN